MNSRAFTIIELLISVAIFAAMTGLVVAKYGNFNQSVLLTKLAYDVALTIRTAQTYGLSVKNSDAGSGTDFQSGYGVRFDTDNSNTDGATGNKLNQQIIFFADRSVAGATNGVYTSSDGDPVSTYAVKRGAIIYGVCFSDGCSDPNTPQSGVVDITFKRPDPNAKICLVSGGNTCDGKMYAEIMVKATDGGVRTISVRENGQISVKD